MNRRQFFKLSVGGIATAAAVSREWPFKVFSFSKDIVIAKTADVDRAARRLLDPIVSMAIDGSNAFFFSGIVRRPSREEFDDFMQSPASLARDAYRRPEVELARVFVREVRDNGVRGSCLIDQYGTPFPLPDLPVFHPGGDL